MTHEELNVFLTNHPQVSWARDEEGNLLLRHDYFDAEHEKVKIEPAALAGITPAQLEAVLINGRDVDHITRVTGYFSRVSGWNKGKQGELVDRKRVLVG